MLISFNIQQTMYFVESYFNPQCKIVKNPNIVFMNVLHSFNHALLFRFLVTEKKWREKYAKKLQD